MKKTISLILSAIMLLSALMANTTAYAAGFASYAKTVELNTWYTGLISTSDYFNENDYTYSDIYKISIPIQGLVTIKMQSESYYYWREGNIDIYKSTNTQSTYTSIDTYSYYGNNWEYDSFNGYYFKDYNVTFDQGVYYFLFEVDNDTAYRGDLPSYSIQFKYTPTISKPSSFKVNSRNTTSLKLNWSNVGDIDGYKLQRKSGDSWKTLTNTTSNSYTVKNLKAGTKYNFRVRSYVEADGVKYYSSWKTLETPTKPKTPLIKTPSTNKKHQIIAKWNKVSKGSGYQVQFSKKKNFSSVIATKTVSGINKTSYTGKNFTKGRKYYVRVRAYKSVNGTKYYSSWSKVKSIKCK